jgi:sugar (pentulose or hexulose) kinase
VGSNPDYRRINQEVSSRKAAEDGLFFFPFSGLCDGKNIFRKATFTGLDLSHDQFHMARAVMEAVAFQVRWMMEAFPTKADRNGIVLAGGASKSPVWTQILADIMNLPVRIPENPDLACVGAAILAGTGCGLYPDVCSGYEALAVASRCCQPNQEQAEVYERCYIQYRKLAGALGDMYQVS